VKNIGETGHAQPRIEFNVGGKFGNLSQRKAHPPLVARASVIHGVEGVVRKSHRNRTATRGWMVRLLLLFFETASLMHETNEI